MPRLLWEPIVRVFSPGGGESRRMTKNDSGEERWDSISQVQVFSRYKDIGQERARV